MKEQPIPEIVMQRVTPFLPVKDVQAAIEHYKTYFGFEREWYWPRETEAEKTDGACYYGKLELLFTLKPDLAEKMRGFELIVFVNDVDAYYAELRRRGANLRSAPALKPWGIYEFTAEDLNGYYLRFCQPGPE